VQAITGTRKSDGFTTEAQRARRESVFFPGRETAAREKKPPASPIDTSLRLFEILSKFSCERPLMQEQTVGVRLRESAAKFGCGFATLCSLCLCGEQTIEALVST
jgi:hypothetical protein